MGILGDMLELGPDSEQEHRGIGQWAAGHPEISFFVAGIEMQAFAEACPAARYFPVKADLEKFLEEFRPEGKIILLKASRGMKLETLLGLL